MARLKIGAYPIAGVDNCVRADRCARADPGIHRPGLRFAWRYADHYKITDLMIRA